MKILLINKFHYNKGGSETYYFAQAEALRAKGHEVINFAMEDKNNITCEQSKYFVPNVDYNNIDGMKDKIRAVINLFHNKIAAERMERLIQHEHPDIAHVGLLHRQITFSVIEVLKRYNIPVVMTMHDLIFACPNYTMLTNGIVCEKCLKGSVINCVIGKCVKNSIAKSFLAAIEKVYLMRKNYYNLIDLYITECEHYKYLMNLARITKSRIITKSNFLPIQQKYNFNKNYKDYILYFGRFSKEKGLMTLLQAHKNSDCKRHLVLVGAGPMKQEMEYFVKINDLVNVEFLGPIYGIEMEKLIEEAKTIVVPSEWYENCPYAVLQSMAKGKIVIASRIGGLPELIADGENGFLFEAKNTLDLISKVEMVFSMNKEEYENMSEYIMNIAKKKFYWSQYADFLIDNYIKLLEEKSK